MSEREGEDARRLFLEFLEANWRELTLQEAIRLSVEELDAKRPFLKTTLRRT